MKVTSKVLTLSAFYAIADAALRPYQGNVYIEGQTQGPSRFSFTLETRDAHKYGSRRSASGRAMRKASWEAHRDVLRALFAADPAARVNTAFAVYRGQADFEASFEATGDHNCGSLMSPVSIRDCSVSR